MPIDVAGRSTNDASPSERRAARATRGTKSSPTGAVTLSLSDQSQPVTSAPRRRFRREARGGFSLLTMMGLLAVPAAAQTPDAGRFVLALNQSLSARLGSSSLDPAERRRRFALLIDQNLDFEVIGERMLGWRWAQATPSDRQGFGREFRNYLIQTFAMRTVGLGDTPMTVISVVEDGETVLVKTELASVERGRHPLTWRLLHRGAEWRLCDIVVNTVSMTSIMRSQFDAVLRNAPSEIGPLLRLLRERSLG